MTNRPTTLLALTGCLAVLLAGCGSDKEDRSIPANVASTLQHRLDVVEGQFHAGGGACADIQDRTFPVIEQDLANLPSSVDRKTRNALVDSFSRLRQLTVDQCDETKGQDTTTDTTPAPETTQTETTPTSPETTQTETTPSTPEKPPKQEKPGKGNKNGSSGGGGGGAQAPAGG